ACVCSAIFAPAGRVKMVTVHWSDAKAFFAVAQAALSLALHGMVTSHDSVQALALVVLAINSMVAFRSGVLPVSVTACTSPAGANLTSPSLKAIGAGCAPSLVLVPCESPTNTET